MKKRFSAAAVTGLALTVILAGCSSGTTPAAPGTSPQAAEKQKEQITLRMTIWGSSQLTVGKNDEVIKLFEKAYPHIKIEAESYAGDVYFDKLGVMAASNNMPDIIRMDYAQIKNYANRDLLLPLDSFLEDKTFDTTGINKTHIDVGRINGKLYGLNIGNNAPVMFYNPEILEKAGVKPPGPDYTWEQYGKDLESIKTKTGIYGDTHQGFLNFAVWLREKGAHLYNEDQTSLGYQDNQLFIDFVQQQLDWQKKGLITPLGVELEVKGMEDGPFPKGNAAFGSHVGGTSYWSNNADSMETALKKPLGYAMFPGSGNKKGMYIKPSFFHSVAKTSKHPKEAAQFIEFYTNSLEAARSLNAYFGMPYNPKLIAGMQDIFSETQKRVANYLTLVEQNSSAIDPPDPVAGSKINKLFRTISDEIFFEQITPKEGAEKFRKQANDILTQK